MLRIAFAVAPIAFGLDKFFNVLVDWPQYLAPWVNDIVPGSAQDLMYVVGVVEILAGVPVALKPRYGAPLVAAWLAGIIFNLLTFSGWYDVALRDFGLMLGALTLARLAFRYDPPRGGATLRPDAAARSGTARLALAAPAARPRRIDHEALERAARDLLRALGADVDDDSAARHAAADGRRLRRAADPRSPSRRRRSPTTTATTS